LVENKELHQALQQQKEGKSKLLLQLQSMEETNQTLFKLTEKQMKELEIMKAKMENIE